MSDQVPPQGEDGGWIAELWPGVEPAQGPRIGVPRELLHVALSFTDDDRVEMLETRCAFLVAEP